MRFKWQLKNKKLTIVAFFWIFLFLGFGKLAFLRSGQKKILIHTFSSRIKQPPLTAKTLPLKKDYLYYQASVEGWFDNAHTFLLDNKTLHHRIGYEVYTPFKVKGVDQVILVDRGIVPLEARREILPTIPPILETVMITGLLTLPPRYVALGPMTASTVLNWPLRIEFIEMGLLEKYVSHALFPYVLSLPANHPYGFDNEWQINTLTPEKHTAYAVQWFALAFTLLILFAILNFKQE